MYIVDFIWCKVIIVRNLEEIKKHIKNYNKILNTFLEIANDFDVNNDRDRDALIQIFEYTIESSWKLWKYFLEYAGLMDLTYPKQVIKEMYISKLITKPIERDQMIDIRNKLSYTYDEEYADSSALYIMQNGKTLFTKFLSNINSQIWKLQ